MGAAQLAQSLGGFTERNAVYHGLCPAHDDHNHSFEITEKNGNTVFICRAGCSQDAVITALKDRGLWEGKDKQDAAPQVKGKVVARYHFKDQYGKLLYWKERIEPGKDGRRKRFAFKHKNPATGKDEFGHGDHNPHILYNLDKVIQTSLVFVCEGEGKADLVDAMGLVGTSLDSGAKEELTNDMKAALDALAGKNVALCSDNDAIGHKFMQAVAAYLHGKAKKVKIIEFTGLPEKGDLKEWISIPGNDKARLLALATDAPEWMPQDVPEEANGNAAIYKPSGKSAVREVTLIQGSTIQPEHITWVWNGWFPLGKLTIVAGQPGTGKTTVMLAIMTAITIGGSMPDGTATDKGSVVMWSGEDGIADTLIPRLIAMGADMTKVFFVAGKGNIQFDPSQDMQQLAETIKTIPDVKMVVIDPVVSAINGDSHKNAEVRKGLQPLVDLGRDTNACIVGISHFNKSGGNTSNPGDLISGSIAFIAIARVVIGAAKLNAPDPEHGHSRILCRIKSNIGPDEDGIGYDLRMEALADYEMEASTVLWGSYVKGHSRDLLAQQPQDDGARADTKLAAAAEWLTELLSTGPVESQAVKEDAETASVSWATVRRAKTSLKVIDYKEPGKGGRWKWRLPTEDERKPRPLPFLIGTIEDAQVTCSNSITFEQEQHEQLEQHADSNSLNLLNLPMLKREENMSKLPDEPPEGLFDDDIEDPFEDLPDFDLSDAA